MSQRWCTFILLALGVALLSPVTGQSRPDAGAKDQFVGAWRLVSIETLRPNGEVIFPFYGKHPEGVLMYDASGWMSVQVVSDPAATVPSDDSREAVMKASDADKSKAFDSYYAYFGTWAVDVAQKTVTHHIRQSLIPGERREDGVRHYAMDRDRLILTAKTHEMGEDHQRKLVWQRLAQP
jgi:Lipocalin-like domain